MITKLTWGSMLRTFTFRVLSPTRANIAVKYLQLGTSWTCTYQRSIVKMCSRWILSLAGGDKRLYDYIVSHLEDGQKAFKCTLCGKVSAHKTNLRKHVENIHFPGLFIYTCKYCPQTFPTKNLLNHHVTNSHRSNVSYWAGIPVNKLLDLGPHCVTLSGDKALYEYIVKYPEGGPGANKCTLCGKVSSNRSNLRNHVENIHFPGMFTYSCKHCHETFNTRNFLNMHIGKLHKLPRV